MSFQGPTQGDQPSELEGIYFKGTVVENNDPDMAERIKVSIPDIFEGDSKNFPWCSPAKASWFPNTSAFGVFGLIPPIGTEINIVFQQGNPLYPLYFAYPHQKGKRVNDFVTNYLKRYGWKDPQGNLFFIDTTSGVDPQVKFQHVSGFIFTLNHNGDFFVTTPGKSNIHSDGDMTLTSGTHIIMQAPRIDLN